MRIEQRNKLDFKANKGRLCGIEIGATKDVKVINDLITESLNKFQTVS